MTQIMSLKINETLFFLFSPVLLLIFLTFVSVCELSLGGGCVCVGGGGGVDS